MRAIRYGVGSEPEHPSMFRMEFQSAVRAIRYGERMASMDAIEPWFQSAVRAIRYGVSMGPRLT